MPQRLRIPDSYAATLAELMRLTPEELAELLKVVREQEPTLALAALTDSIASSLSIDRQRMGKIVRSLADLQTVREGFGLSVNDFVAELRAALEASGKEELRPPDWAAFENGITQALAGENALSVSSKARSLIEEFPRAYCTSRVLTDMRPVFESDVGHDPAAFVIVHTLKIIYHEHDEHLEFFVVLDRHNIEQLSLQLKRALDKEASLKNWAATKEMRVLEVEI